MSIANGWPPCLQTHQQYCARHGLDYFVVEKEEINFRHRGFRHPAWAKIPLVNRLMSEGYPYCMVIDADVAILNDSVKPEFFTGLFKPDIDLVLNEGDEYFNTGFILGRSTPTHPCPDERGLDEGQISEFRLLGTGCVYRSFRRAPRNSQES